MKVYLELTTTWTIHLAGQTLDFSGLGSDQLAKTNGLIIVDQIGSKLAPLVNFPIQEIVALSTELVNQHLSSFKLEKIIEQRQKLEVIPIAMVNYRHPKKNGVFYVYGQDKKVKFDDYPSKVCSIL